MLATSSKSAIVTDTMVLPIQEKPATTTSVTKSADTTPSNPRKRRLPDTAPSSPNTKMAKQTSVQTSPKEGTPSATRSPTPLLIDKNNWQGFCEIESDPAYFSVILREMGVENVTVREVLTMDPNYLQASLPQPIHGLILLFNYREFGNADQSPECPSNVWFANQLPAQNSCATLAMINILMNSADVQIGEHLSQFKDFTRDLTPYQRGEVLSSFNYIKRIHNSFAKKMDILESDKLLSSKVYRAQRLKAQDQDAAIKPNTKRNSKTITTKSRHRRASADSVATQDSASAPEEDTGHHFIAFVPIGTSVYKLDGLDKQPSKIGSFDPQNGEPWLSALSDTLTALMAAGDNDYGAVALTQSPLLALRAKASRAYNTMTLIEQTLVQYPSSSSSSSNTNNHDSDNETPNMPPPYEKPCLHTLGITHDLALHPLHDHDSAAIKSAAPADNLQRFAALASELSTLTASIVAETLAQADEEVKAAQRRFDAGPLIKRWLEMLAGNGHLERHLQRFMPVDAKRAGKR